MSSPRQPSRYLELWLAVNVAVAIAILAYVAPVEDLNSDGAVALLSSQALLEHGTLAIDAYDSPELAYVLDGDYRVREHRGRHYYFSFGTPIFAAPFVFLANRLGLDMRDQEDEFWTQDFVSAIVCGTVFLLLYTLARAFASWPASLAIALVSSLGSALVSTLATALWNAGFAIVFMGGALLVLVYRRPLGTVGWLAIALLTAAAFLCRPTAGFLVLGLVVYAVLESRRPWSWAAGIAAAVAAALALVFFIDAQGWILGYYSPRKLTPQVFSPLRGLYGLLASPSRGLLVFSPFLIAVAAAVALRFTALRRQSLLWLALVWIGSHLAALSVREVWWGGHAFGPRMLIELLLPGTLLTCLVWRELTQGPALPRRRFAGAYLALAIPALIVNTGEGLFNLETLRWNKVPSIDSYPEYLFSWRYPQFLASSDQIGRRLTEIRIRELPDYELGARAAFDTGAALFLDWYDAEPGGRWSRGRSAIAFRPRLESVEALYLLEIEGATLTPRAVGVSVNGEEVGSVELGPGRPPVGLVLVSGDRLRKRSHVRLRFDVPEPTTAGSDRRLLGMRLVAFRLSPWSAQRAIRFDDDPFFLDGWSRAETGWRWSNGELATVLYPVAAVAARDYVLDLVASGLGRQEVTVELNGSEIGTVELGAQDHYALRFPGSLLRQSSLNEIRLRIPSARRVPPDPRRLGVRFVTLQIRPATGPPR